MLPLRGVVVLAAVLSVFAPQPSMADCMTLTPNIRWERIDSDQILIYRSRVPYGTVRLLGCRVRSHSKIQVIKEAFCSYDPEVFIVDNVVCQVRQVERF